jgi:hypothetical protein
MGAAKVPLGKLGAVGYGAQQIGEVAGAARAAATPDQPIEMDLVSRLMDKTGLPAYLAESFTGAGESADEQLRQTEQQRQLRTTLDPSGDVLTPVQAKVGKSPEGVTQPFQAPSQPPPPAEGEVTTGTPTPTQTVPDREGSDPNRVGPTGPTQFGETGIDTTLSGRPPINVGGQEITPFDPKISASPVQQAPEAGQNDPAAGDTGQTVAAEKKDRGPFPWQDLGQAIGLLSGAAGGMSPMETGGYMDQFNLQQDREFQAEQAQMDRDQQMEMMELRGEQGMEMIQAKLDAEMQHQKDMLNDMLERTGGIITEEMVKAVPMLQPWLGKTLSPQDVGTIVNSASRQMATESRTQYYAYLVQQAKAQDEKLAQQGKMKLFEWALRDPTGEMMMKEFNPVLYAAFVQFRAKMFPELAGTITEQGGGAAMQQGPQEQQQPGLASRLWEGAKDIGGGLYGAGKEAVGSFFDTGDPVAPGGLSGQIAPAPSLSGSVAGVTAHERKSDLPSTRALPPEIDISGLPSEHQKMINIIFTEYAGNKADIKAKLREYLASQEQVPPEDKAALQLAINNYLARG